MTTVLPCFDDLMKMAKDNPEELNTLRNKMMQEMIDSASPEQKTKLEGLQWKINKIIETSSNPLHATIRLSREMNNSLLELNDAWHGRLPAKEKGNNNIIPFKESKCQRKGEK